MRGNTVFAGVCVILLQCVYCPVCPDKVTILLPCFTHIVTLQSHILVDHIKDYYCNPNARKQDYELTLDMLQTTNIS